MQQFPEDNPEIHILDLGTGSGAISLALAKERPHWHIVATDISEKALQVAKKNAKKLAIPNIVWLQGYWFDALSASDRKFDVIISNPPYIAEGDPHLDSSLKYEPERALVSGNEGIFDLQYIAERAAQYLKNAGWNLLEHGATQAKAVGILLEIAGFSHIKTIKDLAGVNRVTLGQFKKP